MMTISERVGILDVTIFDAIESQTLRRERVSLLAVQRAMARENSQYAYLEIGSHLGGSLQPHYLDDRCAAIYSIDSRPEVQPDERVPGYTCYYEGNSSKRMRQLLRELDSRQLSKLICFDATVSEVELLAIERSPKWAFIDGEHTHNATLADFLFCRQVMAPGGAILFHDSGIILAAIAEASRQLSREGVDHLPLLLEGTISGLFLDRNMVESDDYLAGQLSRHGDKMEMLFRKARLKRMLPPTLVHYAQELVAAVRRVARN